MGKAIGFNMFLIRAEKIHNGKYDYGCVKWINTKEKICIVCPIHGEFYQSAEVHLRGSGCPFCGRKKAKDVMTKTTEQYIEDARKIHGNKYDYSKTEYNGAYSMVTITCPEHGDFEQRAIKHLCGHGCRICAKREQPSTQRYIEKARKVHGNKYDYSKTIYTNVKTPITITCPTHGDFEQNPSHHLKGCGCPQCAVEKRTIAQSSTTREFVKKAQSIWGDLYDYSKVDYKNNHTKVCVICSEHGEFWQYPSYVLKGGGCPLCTTSKGEQIIFEFLTREKLKFEREYYIRLSPTNLGRNNIFADFFISRGDKKYIVEFNGKQHYERIPYFHKTQEDFMRQKVRDERLREWCKENEVKYIEIKYSEIDRIENILKTEIQ